jgi:hypothetical protein
MLYAKALMELCPYCLYFHGYGVGWINVAEDRVSWRILVTTVINVGLR